MAERLERELLKNVPIFFGLKLTQMRRFLEICSLTNVASGEIICSYGEPSKKCFVLLQGRLDILTGDGVSVAQLEPVQTVGEMGIVSRRPRAATVKTIGPVRLLEFGFQRLESLLDSDVELRVRLYRNFMRVLSSRLSDTNDMAARYKKLYEEATGTADAALIDHPPAVAESSDEDQSAGAATVDVSRTDGAAHAHVSTFFELQQRLPDKQDLEEGRKVVAELYEKGYSDIDIEYAVKWTARNIPTARRFSMIQVSIQEALEDKWSI
jgi:CRP/FNR family transcriptional regulator, cyclic AMP receptor protein